MMNRLPSLGAAFPISPSSALLLIAGILCFATGASALECKFDGSIWNRPGCVTIYIGGPGCRVKPRCSDIVIHPTGKIEHECYRGYAVSPWACGTEETIADVLEQELGGAVGVDANGDNALDSLLESLE